jgi:hypothetical protein
MVPFLARCLLYTKSRQSAIEKTKPLAVDNINISEPGGACRKEKTHRTISLTVLPNWLKDLWVVRRRLAALTRISTE